MQKQVLGGDLTAIPDYPLEPRPAERAQAAHPAPHRDARAADAKHQTQPLEDSMAARP